MKPARKILTKYDIRCMPFPWSATFGDYDLGDIIGVGATEDEAILDLKLEDELHDS